MQFFLAAVAEAPCREVTHGAVLALQRQQAVGQAVVEQLGVERVVGELQLGVDDGRLPDFAFPSGRMAWRSCGANASPMKRPSIKRAWVLVLAKRCLWFMAADVGHVELPNTKNAF